MPFLTYQVTTERALLNAGRVMQETGCDAVKIEGGSPEIAGTARALVRTGIPVMGHLGFTPQSVNVFGGFRVQGREPAEAERLVDDARRLEDAGAFSLVLELIPPRSPRASPKPSPSRRSASGPAPGCDGQVLVLFDLLGMNDGFRPKFLKRYASMADDVRGAVRRFGDDVRAGAYPAGDHSF
jgi:3-methyl-2-oxobutanoate hydroxymethyltransferase